MKSFYKKAVYVITQLDRILFEEEPLMGTTSPLGSFSCVADSRSCIKIS